MAGFQKIYRSIQTNWLWEDKPFSRGQAFIDLILLVNHSDNKTMVDGELVEVKRGSRITSLRKLGESWGWSPAKVKKFLEQLQKDNMIVYKCDNKKTLVAIENYSVYQDKENTEQSQKEQSAITEQSQNNFRTISEQFQNNTNKKDKEYIKNVKEREEGKEVPKGPLPLSFLTNIHKEIFNLLGEASYATWFMDSVIKDQGELLIIEVDKEFKKNIIQNKYVEKLSVQLKKKISVKLKEGEKSEI